MSDLVKNIIINSLKMQSEIFGDDIFDSEIQIEIHKNPSKRILSTEVETLSKSEAENLESVKKEENVILPKITYDFDHIKSLSDFEREINVCQNCSLGKTRTKFVFGKGNPKAEIMLIGEAPGADEDKLGEPFVGKAGKLLTDILKAINLSREEVYIANILKCRPPNNRDPLPNEAETCMPYLLKQIELIQPKMILCLGRIAATTLLSTTDSLTKMREKVYKFQGITMMVTYHPAALLRNPGWKKYVWEDVQKFMQIYRKEKANG